MESNDKLEQLLRQMYAKETLHEEDIDTSDIVDDEWTKFEAEHFGKDEQRRSIIKPPLLKIAAMFLGVLMLSGIAYAAVRIIISSPETKQEQQANVTANTELQQIGHELAEQDSIMMQPVVFEDTELGTILYEVAAFYQCEAIYKNEKVKHLRLYFTWDKTARIDDVVETFNKFERFHITRENQKLIVE